MDEPGELGSVQQGPRAEVAAWQRRRDEVDPTTNTHTNRGPDRGVAASRAVDCPIYRKLIGFAARIPPRTDIGMVGTEIGR